MNMLGWWWMLNKVTLWSRPGYRCGCAGGHDLRYFQVGERVCVSRRARALAPCLFVPVRRMTL